MSPDDAGTFLIVWTTLMDDAFHVEASDEPRVHEAMGWSGVTKLHILGGGLLRLRSEAILGWTVSTPELRRAEADADELLHREEQATWRAQGYLEEDEPWKG